MNALYLVANLVAEVDDGQDGYESGLRMLGIVLLIGLIVVVVVGVCGAIGYSVGQDRGRRWDGMWLGVLLGPLGIFIASRLRDNRPNRDEERMDAEELKRLADLLTHGDISREQFDGWRRKVLARQAARQKGRGGALSEE